MRQHLPEQLLRVLRAMIRIVARAAVAEPDVEVSVRTEHEIAAVVVRERLRDERVARGAAPPQVEPRRRVGHDRIARAAKPRDDGVAGWVREVHEEPSACRIRREREAEQPLFAAEDQRRRQVDEIGRQDGGAAHDPDAAVLLHDELHGAIEGILDERERRREARRLHARPQLRVQIGDDGTGAKNASFDSRPHMCRTTCRPHGGILMHVSRLWVLLFGAVFVACGSKTPPAPPVVDSPPASETINGTERVGWDQRAADAVELATIHYAIYVDNTRSELADASCAASPTSAAFACSARLPALSNGSHALQIASFKRQWRTVRLESAHPDP